MAGSSSIEWTEATWNPITGCTRVSPGCKNCYAARMTKRLEAMGVANYSNGFRLTVHRHVLKVPLSWRKPRTIFVNSMSDLFHRDVPEDFIVEVFDVMREARWHQFQVLTKRPERVFELNGKIRWPENVWLGTTVETAAYTFRIDYLRKTDARTKFLSMEPLLGPVPDLDLKDVHWVIVGGESGPRARPMEEDWVLRIKDQCDSSSVPFFFKQWGGVHKKRNGRLLQGRTWDGLPSVGLSATRAIPS